MPQAHNLGRTSHGRGLTPPGASPGRASKPLLCLALCLAGCALAHRSGRAAGQGPDGSPEAGPWSDACRGGCDGAPADGATDGDASAPEREVDYLDVTVVLSNYGAGC